MDWIKKNLMLVIAGVVVFALFGGAGFFLWSKNQNHLNVKMEFDKATAEVERLYNSKPSINQANLELLAQDQKRVEEVMMEAKSRFKAAAEREMGIAAFKKLLDETLFELTRDAESANVTIPPNYNFTFEIQKAAVNFVPGSIPPLAARLAEVKSICETLYAANVHSVDRLRRVIVSTDDREGSPDYLIQRPVTNELAGMVRIPYEVTFTGFTKELATVIKELSTAKEFFVVRNLTSEPAPPPAAVAPVQPAQIILARPGFQPVAPPPSSSDCCSSCAGGECGCGGGGAPRRPVLPAYPTTVTPRIVAAPPKSTSNALLDERLLRFTLTLDVIVPISTNSVPNPESAAGAVSSTGAN